MLVGASMLIDAIYLANLKVMAGFGSMDGRVARRVRVESPTREFVELVVARVGACGPGLRRRRARPSGQELRGHGAAAGPTTRWSDARRRLILGTVPRIRAQNGPENVESRVARIAPNHPGFFYFAEERT